MILKITMANLSFWAFIDLRCGIYEYNEKSDDYELGTLPYCFSGFVPDMVNSILLP